MIILFHSSTRILISKEAKADEHVFKFLQLQKKKEKAKEAAPLTAPQ